jgi:imidazolonepropionase
MAADLIITNIKTLYTPCFAPPVRGKDLSKISSIDQAFIAVKNERILDFGNHDFTKHIGEKTIIYSANNQIVIPGLIDSHTHLVHAGSREDEYGKILQGVPYLDILKSGGGILSTVEKTRKASFDELLLQSQKSLDLMMTYGVTVVEAKSGYGLELKTEVKQLDVIKKLTKTHPVHLLSTYMGAHAVPKELRDDKERYISQMMDDMKYIKKHDLATAVDVFCESSVFSLEETKRLLTHAKKLGYSLKLHSDEMNSLGGVGLGIELGASSVDHLMKISDEDIERLSYSNTAANLLPGTSFNLNKDYAPARKMIDKNVILSISGDYNPGSCPTENFQLIMQLASNKLKMKPEEVLNATTINPAYHLGISKDFGSIEKSKFANFVIMNAPNLNYIFYHYGINHATDVFIKGKQVVKNQQIVREL